MEITGRVIKGCGWPHKVPTANVLMERVIDEGAYVGDCYRADDKLGPCAVWVMPHRPSVAEVFIAGVDTNLYGDRLQVRDMERLSREQQIEMYEKALDYE